jgi:hypothetical protein
VFFRESCYFEESYADVMPLSTWQHVPLIELLLLVADHGLRRLDHDKGLTATGAVLMLHGHRVRRSLVCDLDPLLYVW